MRFLSAGNHGIYLPDAGLVLDGSVPASVRAENIHASEPPVFISHAHADHVPRSRKCHVYASPATSALMRARGHSGPVTVIPFGEPLEFPSARVTLYPAGHILGSAMIFIETDKETLLYTGDCRTPPSPVSEGFTMPDRHLDHLIIEATFALPLYKWESHETIFRQIRRFASETLEEGATPVLFCYNLGKAQEVMYALASSPSISVQIHHAGVPLCKVYEQFGVQLGNWEPYNPETLPGKVLITPWMTAGDDTLRNMTKIRTAHVSGWAALESRASQMQADARIPLSDHLDFFELMRLCRHTEPGHVYLTHCPDPDVALHYLQKYGISCSSLDSEINDDG